MKTPQYRRRNKNKTPNLSYRDYVLSEGIDRKFTSRGMCHEKEKKKNRHRSFDVATRRFIGTVDFTVAIIQKHSHARKTLDFEQQGVYRSIGLNSGTPYPPNCPVGPATLSDHIFAAELFIRFASRVHHRRRMARVNNNS